MRRLLFFIGLSISVHLVLLAAPVSFDTPIPKRKNYTTVSLVTPSKQVKQQVRKLREKEEKEEEELHGQVVNLPPDPNSERPEEADLLSETHHKTERETISRYRSLSNRPSAHERSEDSDAEKITRLFTNGPRRSIEPREREIPRVERRDHLNLPESDSGALRNRSASDGTPGKGEILNLFPSSKILAHLDGTPFADSVRNIERGEGTFLNTVAFKHAGFFNRIKRQIVYNWRPLPEIKQRDPTGNIYGTVDRKTVLSVILDKEGNILKLSVRRPSGVDFLDKEAIYSFKRAEQFPNPPKAMIKDGVIEFTFGFNINFDNTVHFF